MLLQLLLSPGKTAEPIKMPFGLWARVGPGNRVLDGGQDPSWKGAILREEGDARTYPMILCRELCKNG